MARVATGRTYGPLFDDGRRGPEWGPVRWAATEASETEGVKARVRKRPAVEEGMKKVLEALDNVCTLDPASFATVYRELVEQDKEKAEQFFRQILDKTAENGMRFLYQMAISSHCKAKDLAGLQRRRDEALLNGIKLPPSVHAAVLGLLRMHGEIEAAELFVREVREEGSPLCSAAATVYVRTLVAHTRCAALGEFLEDLRDESIRLHKPQWSKVVVSIVAELLALPGQVGDSAVDLGRRAYALCEKFSGQPGSAGDEAKCYKRLMELFMTHRAPADAATMVEAFLRVQTASGFGGDYLETVVKTHLAVMTAELIEKGKLNVAMSLAESLCKPQGEGSGLPFALPSVARHVLYHLRYVKNKGPEVTTFLLKSMMPALMRMRVRGYQRSDVLDKCFYNAVCVSHSLPNDVSFRVLEMTLEHYKHKTINSRLMKTLLSSAAYAPTLQQGMDAVDTMSKLRWAFHQDRVRVGISHTSYAHLSPEQMETANKRCFLHFYPETLELVAKTRQQASRTTVRFMLHLLRQLEEHGTSELPEHVVMTVEWNKKGPLNKHQKGKKVALRKTEITRNRGPELRLPQGDDPLPHMQKPPGVTAWDYRNVMVVARQLEYLEALVYAVTMAHSRKLLDSAIALLPVEQRDVQQYIEEATKRNGPES